MKKNAMLKIAAILLVAVLLTTCAISSTFAKYTAGTGDETTAQVAKWGVVASVSLDNLFSNTYESDTSGYTTDTVTSADSTGATLLVAPGTKGSLDLTSTFSGQPEVAVEVKIVPEFVVTGFTAAGATYCPVVFFVNGKVIGFSGMKYTAADGTVKAVGTGDVVATSITDLQDKVLAELNSLDGTAGENGTKYAPNEKDFSELVSTFNFGWEWAFTGNNDTNDSLLGDTHSANTIYLKLTPSITQID